MNKSARLIFSVAPRVPTTWFLIKFHWLPIKAHIEFKICLIVFKALRFGQPKYIGDMLSPPVTISHLTLRSDDDPYRLHEPNSSGWAGICRKVICIHCPHGCIMDCQLLWSSRHQFRALKFNWRHFCCREHKILILILLMKYINCNIVWFTLISPER